MSYFRLTGSRHMEKTRLSSKGQVVLPRSIREAKAWHPGQELAVVSTDEGVLLKPLKPFKNTTIDEVAGFLKYKGKPKSLEEMDAAVMAEAKRRK